MPNKEIVVLCDNDRLARAIELNLTAHMAVRVTDLPLDIVYRDANHLLQKDCDLVIVAASCVRSQPMIERASVSLFDRLGSLPVLLISPQPFLPSRAHTMVCLPFPFAIDALCTRVAQLLYLEPWLAPVQEV